MTDYSFGTAFPFGDAAPFTIADRDNRWVIYISPQGEVTVNPEMTISEAAATFWEAVLTMNPFKPAPAPTEEPEPTLSELSREPVTDEELARWANLRADDAGHLARELIVLRRAAADTPEVAPGGMQAENEMRKLSWLVEWANGIIEKYGDSCIYVRRGGLSWGAVALNYHGDDKKFGVFDLQAKHDRDMIARVEQINRLIADRNKERDLAVAAEAEVAQLRERLQFLNSHTNLELTWGEIDGWEDDCQWRIHSRNGGRNDREWTLRGYGPTVEQAIDAARAAFNAEGK